MGEHETKATLEVRVTEAQLAEWEALARGATSGPWEFDPESGIVETIEGAIYDFPDATRDPPFIAAARTALPALCDEVRRLREVLLGVEWAGGSQRDRLCPQCGRSKDSGHARYCTLAAALRQYRGEG